MKKSFLVLIVVSLAIPAFADVIVNSPGNGAQVATSFALSAYADTCSSQPVASMGYSFDSSSDTTIVNGTAVNVQLSAGAGQHTVHVKAWGNQGASCVTDVNVTVGSTSAPATSASGITVSSPGNGASVGTSFAVQASASQCYGQALSAMGYSLDGSSQTTTVNGTSVNTSVSTSVGAHTLHVKSWGNQGAACDADVAINVTASAPAPVAAAVPSSSVSVSSPSANGSVTSPFQVSASASNCSGQSVSTMGYSLDSSTTTTMVAGAVLSRSVSSGTGSHTLHVKAWGNKGAACDTDVPVNVTSVANASSIPSSAISVSAIQSLGGWQAVNDSAAGGSSSGSTSITATPSLSGHARVFSTSYSNNGDERYEVSFADDSTSTNFFYDGWLYLDGSAGNIGNLEMDLNQTMPNGQTVIFGFQCDGYSSTWDYTANKGTPQKPVDTWVHTGQYCNPRAWSRNAWHHVQVSYSRDGSGNVTFHSVWLDDNEQALNVTANSAFALGWGPALVTNFQVDGLGAGGSQTVRLDNLVVYRW